MNSRWRQIFKNFKKWNIRIQKTYGFKHRCLSKTERKRIKQGSRALRKVNMEFVFEEVEEQGAIFKPYDSNITLNNLTENSQADA